MCFVGIDPSITCTAVVVLDDQAVLLKAFTIESARPAKGWKMRTKIIKELSAQIWRYFNVHIRDKWAIDAIVLEGYSYASRYQSHQLGELGFTFRRHMIEYYKDISYVIPPKRLKKFVTGNGNAKKEVVAGFIYDLYGLKFDNFHLSDACAGALFGLALSGISDLFTEDQLKLVEEYG